MGKPIKVTPNDSQGLDQFEKHVTAGINSMWGRDVRLVRTIGVLTERKLLSREQQMYEIFGNMGFGMTDEDYETQKELLGKEPSNYEEFVKRVGAEWRKELESAQSKS